MNGLTNYTLINAVEKQGKEGHARTQNDSIILPFPRAATAVCIDPAPARAVLAGTRELVVDRWAPRLAGEPMATATEREVAPESPCAHTLMSDQFHPSSVPTGTYHLQVNDKRPAWGPRRPLTSVHDATIDRNDRPRRCADASCRVGIGFCLPRLPVCGLGGGWRRTGQTVRAIPIPTGQGIRFA
jgi:hypothetical protein